ncbi:MAG: hypothetical protein FWD03_03530 [Defluviitaleaceae bacterium]|nr:hypothetical protein [Defluviitaleaceae bacterium]
MDIERLFSQRAFSQLEPRQLQLIRQFAMEIKGKGATEVARLYMQLNQKVNQINPLSAEQRNAIIEAIRNFLPEGDRGKLNAFLRMVGR